MHEIHQQHTIQNEPENNSDRTNMDSINKSHIMGMQGSVPIYQSGSVKVALEKLNTIIGNLALVS